MARTKAGGYYDRAPASFGDGNACGVDCLGTSSHGGLPSDGWSSGRGGECAGFFAHDNAPAFVLGFTGGQWLSGKDFLSE